MVSWPQREQKVLESYTKSVFPSPAAVPSMDSQEGGSKAVVSWTEGVVQSSFLSSLNSFPSCSFDKLSLREVGAHDREERALELFSRDETVGAHVREKHATQWQVPPSRPAHNSGGWI